MSRSTVLAALSRFNDAHPWSHNDAYAGWVLRQARKVRADGGTRALDVGCGTGNLAARLAGVMDDVVGAEPDARTAAIARANLLRVPNAEVRPAGFDNSLGDFDLITFVAVLHHLPLAETLRTARGMLRPGGRLVVVGVPRDSPGDWPWALPSVLLNPVVGMARHPHRATAPPENMTAPVRPPAETFEEVAAVMRRELPGVVVRRRLFWRYTATWRRPR